MGGIDPMPLPTVHSLGNIVTKGADEKTALKSFEAYVVGEMMRTAAPKNFTGGDSFDGGQAGRMYRDHLYQEYARLIAENGDFGLASQLEGHLGPADQRAAAGIEGERKETTPQTNPRAKEGSIK
mgnify:CR=1 FL=1